MVASKLRVKIGNLLKDQLTKGSAVVLSSLSTSAMMGKKPTSFYYFIGFDCSYLLIV